MFFNGILELLVKAGLGTEVRADRFSGDFFGVGGCSSLVYLALVTRDPAEE